MSEEVQDSSAKSAKTITSKGVAIVGLSLNKLTRCLVSLRIANAKLSSSASRPGLVSWSKQVGDTVDELWHCQGIVMKPQ